MVNEFLKKFMKDTDNDILLDRWEKLGFLRGIEGKRLRIATAEWFDEIANYLLKNDDKVKELLNNKELKQKDLEIIIFPIIRRTLDTLNFIQTIRRNPETFINEIASYWDENMDFLNNHNISNIDKEAEICAGFVTYKSTQLRLANNEANEEQNN